MKKIGLLVLAIITTQYSSAQVRDSADMAKYNAVQDYPLQNLRFTPRQLYVPGSLILAGIAFNGRGEESLKNEILEERNEHMGNFSIHADDYLQFSPIAIAYGMDALGLKSKTDMKNRSAILLKGELGMLATISLLKNTTHIQRPDGSNYVSFPSGHTAQAFAAATFLSEEYKGRYPWIPIVSYGIASSVGLLRMANNKHYISDVLVGAGIGVLSMKLSYWTHQYKWKKRNRPNTRF